MNYSQTLLPTIILVVIVAILVAVFFTSKHNYEKKQQINVFYGKLRFFYTGKSRYKRFKLKGVNEKVWNKANNSDDQNNTVYFDLKKKYFFKHDDLKYLTDQQIEALSRYLINYPNISYDSVYEGKNISQLKIYQNELNRFKQLIKQRELHHQVQNNFFNLSRNNQIVILRRRYKLNRTNLDTLSEDEAKELESCVNAYLSLVNSINYNSDSVMVLGSLTQQLQKTSEEMIRRAKVNAQTEGLTTPDKN